MPRIKLETAPIAHDTKRRDTINLRTIVTYDPRAPRPTTPILVGKYVVARRPLQDGLYTEYLILDGATVVQTQISVPSEGDCADAIQQHQRTEAAKMVGRTIAKAKKRHAKPAREEVLA